MEKQQKLLIDLYQRLVEDYNGNEAFKQHEEDRLIVAHCVDTILWQDDFITIFCDMDKCLLVFVNKNGNSKVLSFDDNFYSVEDNILAYDELIKKANLDDDEQKVFLGNYYRFCEEKAKQDDYELNTEYLSHRGLVL